MERNYEFRKRLLEVHKRDMRDDSIWMSADGCIVDECWEIVYPLGEGRVIENAAYDLLEYFRVSMGMYLRVRGSKDIVGEVATPRGKIILTTAELTPELASSSEQSMAFRMYVDDGVVVCGRADRGAAQGAYFVEERMNLARGPVIARGESDRAPLFSPRMTHSGYGLDMYPDAHIRAIAHAGMDAILVFVKDVDRTPHGYLDFNELIDRAAGFGVDVYVYSYMISERHPDDPDALEFYEGTYGRLFKQCPGFKGVVLVGESCEFPSKDPRVVPLPYYKVTKENNPGRLPSPGWFPCTDYPQWVNMVKGVIRAHKPDADFVLWTYNWGYVNREDRLALIRALPTDLSLEVTFEMFEKFEKPGGVNITCVDYTLSFEGPGQYFASEAAEAKARSIPLYAMANTGGLTWDIGVIPYQPCPDQWKRRYDAMLRAREEWGLSGVMESHHYGFWPSFVSELAKASFWSPAVDYEQLMLDIATRDFGAKNAQSMLEVWRLYSDGIRKYVPTNEDQYGPFRIGPAYPLVFDEQVVIPSVDFAPHGGNKICNPVYRYDLKKLPNLLYEIESLGEMKALYAKGNAILASIAASLSGRQRDEAEHLLAMSRFIVNTTHTVINVKKWHLHKCKLLEGECDPAAEIAAMRAIAADEIKNARDTIPFVEYDSRLGFEPSMEYQCDRAHIEWKIAVTERAVAALDGFAT